MHTALEILYRTSLSYKAKRCTIEADGVDHSGMFLLLEVMNTRFIGPSLQIAPSADAGDGELEIILVPEQNREQLASYILNQKNGNQPNQSFDTLKARKIQLKWEGKLVHVDDELMEIKKSQPIKVEVGERMLQFLVPKK